LEAEDVLDTSVDVSLMYTPIEECVAVQLGPIGTQVLARLSGHGYDDAPVVQDGRVLGAVSMVELQTLLDQGQDLGVANLRLTDRAQWLTSSSKTRVPIFQLLTVLLGDRCTFVCDAPRTVLDTAGPVRGFLTISDLNRHVFRAALYGAFAALEAQLAAFIEASCRDPWEWIKSLSEEHQVRILGYWDLSKRHGLDVGPVAAATLTNLLTVAAKSSTIREALGFTKRSEIEKVVGAVPNVRNAVMHPVRPLIGRHDDVQRVLQTMRTVAALHDSLARAAA
jgi:hypothetical protein